MRVSDRQDSMEVLHDTKAAFLQKPGEFYLCNAGGIQYGMAGYAHAKERTDTTYRNLRPTRQY